MSSADASPPPATPSAPARWLYGPLRDLLLGCGGAYAAVFALHAALGAEFRGALPLAAILIVIPLLASSPHYGATIVRVYERQQDRRAYAVFALWTTLLLVGAFAWGMHDVLIGSWFITLYLSWSPWHYAGQNYGVAMMFLHRRGVTVTPLAKRLLWGSFVLSSVLAVTALHQAGPGTSYAPNPLREGDYAFIPLRIPAGLRDTLLIGVGSAYGGCVVGAAWLLARGGKLGDLVPAAALVGSQALWFSVPVLARNWGALAGFEPLGTEQAAYAFLWIGAGHSIQYLWITSWFATRSGTSRNAATFLLKSVGAGAVIWAAPALLFAPGILGSVPFDAGLGLMVAALINLQHFVLDGVIWKLRHGRVASILLRRKGDDAEPVAPTNGLGRRLAWSAGALAFVLTVVTYAEYEYGFNRALERGDIDRASTSIDRLSWLGRDSAELHTSLGRVLFQNGRVDDAIARLETGIDVHPTADGWAALGIIHSDRSEWPIAEAAYETALQLDPEHVVAAFYSGLSALAQGDRPRAKRLLLRAAGLAERDPQTPAEFRQQIDAILDDQGFRAHRAGD